MPEEITREDRALLARLRDMWQSADPVAGDLAERVLFTLQLEDLEVELMRLQEAVEPAGARAGGPVTVSMVSFSSASLTLLLTVSDMGAGLRRVDGWIAPSAALRVELRRGAVTHHGVADADGRFSFEEVTAGLAQLRIHPTAGAAVPLDRPVVTPAVRL